MSLANDPYNLHKLSYLPPTTILKQYYGHITKDFLQYLLTHHDFTSDDIYPFIIRIIKKHLSLLSIVANYLTLDDVNYPLLFDAYITGFSNLFFDIYNGYDHTDPDRWIKTKGLAHDITLDAYQNFGLFNLTIKNIDYLDYRDISFNIASYDIAGLATENFPNTIIIDAINHGMIVTLESLVELLQERIPESYISDIIIASYQMNPDIVIDDLIDVLKQYKFNFTLNKIKYLQS